MTDILSLHNPENALRRCQFTIPGKPFGKQDLRHTKTGMAYVPTETKNYLSLVRLAAAAAWSGDPLEGPLSLEVVIVYAIPSGWSKKRRREALSGLIEPTKKPDGANVRKVIEDGMEGVVYKNDKQVTQYRDVKKYGLKPEVRVLVEESPMRGL